MIRKSGWLIFLALGALIFVFIYFFAGLLIRHGMISSLEKATGAEVNIDTVSLSLAPLSIDISELQITDKEKPEYNTLSFDKAHANIELWPALLGYYVVDQLSVQRLAYGQKRQTVGKVYDDLKADSSMLDGEEREKRDLASVLKVDLPTSDSLMSRANLQTQNKGIEFQKQLAQQQKDIKALESQLPDKAKLNKIQADIKAITESKIANASDLAKKTQQLKSLQEELKAERDKLQNIKNQLAQSREALQHSVSELHAASKADLKRVQELANIGEGGLAPISQILLGDLWGEKIGQLEAIYKMAAPYLPDSLGGSAQAADEIPEQILPNRILPLTSQAYPNFWVKKADIHWLVAGGEASLSAKNITAQHGIINSPTEFSLDINELPKLASFTLNGDFSILKDLVSNIAWEMSGYSLDQLSMGSGENALNLAKGILASTGSLKLVNKQLTETAQMNLGEAIFESGSSNVMQQLIEILNKQKEIPFSLNASGLISRPDVEVTSKLDSIIGDAIMGKAKEKVAKLQSDLRSDIDAQLKSQLSGQPEMLAVLDKQDGQVKGIEDQINEMLKAKMGHLKNEANDKLKEGLLKLKGGF